MASRNENTSENREPPHVTVVCKGSDDAGGRRVLFLRDRAEEPGAVVVGLFLLLPVFLRRVEELGALIGAGLGVFPHLGRAVF